MEVVRVNNPLTLSKDNVIVLEKKEKLSPNEIIRSCGLDFTRPFYLLVNGEPVGRADWDKALVPSDICHFVELPRGGGGGGGRSNPIQIVALIAVAALAWYAGGVVATASWGGKLAGAIVSSTIAIGGSYLVNSFFASGPAQISSENSTQEREVSYTLTGGGNALRLMQPFAEHFGRLKVYPDLEIVPYVQYEVKDWNNNNPQFLFFRGIIGVGYYDVENCFIGDTPIGDFASCTYAVYSPGQLPTYYGSYYGITGTGESRKRYIYNEVVWPNSSLSGMELTPNQLVMVTNPSGTIAERFEVDIYCPVLFSPSLSGTPIIYAYADAYIDMRKIDDSGDPITDWVRVASLWHQTAYVGPVRITKSIMAPGGPGRYELRIWRSVYSGTAWAVGVWSTAAQNNATFVGEIRAFGKVSYEVSYSPPYTLEDDDWVLNNTTRIEVRLKASNQLTGQLANQINVIATRKLYPVTSTGFGSTLTASRCIVDACAYLVTNSNAGGQDSSVLDFESLYALKVKLAALAYYFDWRFQSRLSIIEACAMIARCGRAIPFLPGGKFSLIHDEEKTAPSVIFTTDDYTKDSFELEHVVRKSGDPTGIEIHFIDSDTWKEDSVECFDEDGSNERLAIVQLTGCTTRQHAYEIGMYLYFEDKLCRTLCGFETGLKGHIPSPGSLIAVPTPGIKWDQSGRIQKIEGATIHLSDPVTFDETGEGVLYLVPEDGDGILGPYPVTISDLDSSSVLDSSGGVVNGYSTVTINAALPAGTKTVENDGIEAAKFLFGTSEADVLKIKVTKIVPKGKNSIGIYGSNYDGCIYTEGEAPAVTEALISSFAVAYLRADTDNNEYDFFLSWKGSATSIKVEILTEDSSGASVLIDPLEDHFYYFSSSSPTIEVYAYAYPDLDLDDAWTVEVEVPPTVSGLALDSFEDGVWSFSWDAAAGDSSALEDDDSGVYRVSLFAEGEEVTSIVINALFYTLDVGGLQALGGPWPEFEIRVAYIQNNETGIADTITIDFTAVPAPSGLVDAYLYNGTVLYWDEAVNATGYVIFQSATGSPPNVDSSGEVDSSFAAQYKRVYTGPANEATIITDFSDGRFFHVAGTNIYNLSVVDLEFSTIQVEDRVIDNSGNLVYDNSDEEVLVVSWDIY